MKKLLFVFPSLKISGAEKAIISIANKLIENKEFEITFFVLDNKSDTKGLINDNITVLECNLIFEDKSRLEKIILTYFYFPFLLSKYLKKNKFNYAVSIYEYFSEWTIIIAKLVFRQKIQAVSVIQNSLTLTKKYSNISRKIIFTLIDLVRGCFFNKIIVVANYIKKELKYTNADKLIVIHNPVDLKITYLVDKQVKKYNDIKIEENKYFLNIGRISKQKNQTLLLKAFAEIHEKTNWKLVIIGTIEDNKVNNNLHKIIEQNNISTKVIFIQQSKEIYNLLSQAGVLICTSLFEGFSLVILEAMVLKIPIISTKYTGYNEILDYDNSILIDDYNIEDLANKMIAFANREIDVQEKIINAYTRGSLIHNLNHISNLYSRIFAM